MVEESLELLALRAASSNVELGCFIDYNLPTTWRGDPTRLRQILLNLAGNAVKFTQNGEVSITVTHDKNAAHSNECEQLRFEIRDTGIGISEEAQQLLFQPFAQADSSTTRRFGGTGLGLAISQQIVDLMGGTIGVKSRNGKGSVFWFSIPLQLVSTERGHSNELVSIKQLRNSRLLLVTSEELTVSAIKQYCDAWHIEMVIENNIANASDRIQYAKSNDQAFDFVLGCPCQSAEKYDTTQSHLSQLTQPMSLPLILITSVEYWASGNSSEKAPFIYQLKKPIRKDAFLRILLKAQNTKTQKNPVSVLSPNASKPSNINQKANPVSDLRILITEDNQINQRVIELLLRKLGYSSESAENGRVALDTLEQNDYDIIFMDCHMPELDGYETTQRIRQYSENDSIYIIAMTANTMEGDREKCLQSGMNDYVAKPIRKDALIAALERAAAHNNTMQNKLQLNT